MSRTMKVPWLAALAVAVVSTGCAHGIRTGGRQQERTFCAKSTATLYVQNDNWLDIVIYAVRGGSRFRLGQVTSVQSAVFELPPAALGATSSLFILADPIGTSRAYEMFATDDIMLAPGHTIIDLRLDNVISHSSWSVAVEDPEDI